MRILVLHNKYRERGGEDSVVVAEAGLLERAGHEVHLYQVENPAGNAGAMRALARSPWNGSAAKKVKQLSDEFRPDVVHVHNTWYSLTPSPLWALRHDDIPRVMTLHNYRLVCLSASLHRDGRRCVDCLGHQPWRGIVHRCYHDSYIASAASAANVSLHRMLQTWDRQVELMVVPSSLARDLLVRGGISADRLVVKPHFAPDPGPRPLAPSNSGTVVYAGRFSRDKGLISLAQAWSADPPGDLELLLIGEGELAEGLTRMGPRIRVAGWLSRSELTNQMLQARAVIVPTQMFETFGLTALEAMAAGAPVITIAGSAVHEVVGDGGPPGVELASAADQWRDRLGRLVDGAAVDAWGAAGRARYEEHYRPERGLEQLLAVYESARARLAART
jgi:glycosyltransferase involved in cell wall biosynthesis